MIDDKIIFEQSEIENIYDIKTLKNGHIGTLIFEETLNKYVFMPKLKTNGKFIYYKSWILAKTLTKLNELNGEFKNER